MFIDLKIMPFYEMHQINKVTNNTPRPFFLPFLFVYRLFVLCDFKINLPVMFWQSFRFIPWLVSGE